MSLPKMITCRRSSKDTQNIVQEFSKYPYDCRIICKDGYVEAHAVVLSTASNYLREILNSTGIIGSPQNPVFIMLDYERKTILSIKKFIYEGETLADSAVIQCASQLQLT